VLISFIALASSQFAIVYRIGRVLSLFTFVVHLRAALTAKTLILCQVGFIAVRGADLLSDIAIDNIQITANQCPGGSVMFRSFK